MCAGQTGYDCWPLPDGTHGPKNDMCYSGAPSLTYNKHAKPEPIDVPAIQADFCTTPDHESWPRKGWAKDGSCLGYEVIRKTTCTDRRRILQHDEEIPATYWCHRVSTEGKP